MARTPLKTLAQHSWYKEVRARCPGYDECWVWSDDRKDYKITPAEFWRDLFTPRDVRKFVSAREYLWCAANPGKVWEDLKPSVGCKPRCVNPSHMARFSPPVSVPVAPRDICWAVFDYMWSLESLCFQLVRPEFTLTLAEAKKQMIKDGYGIIAADWKRMTKYQEDLMRMGVDQTNVFEASLATGMWIKIESVPADRRTWLPAGYASATGQEEV